MVSVVYPRRLPRGLRVAARDGRSQARSRRRGVAQARAAPHAPGRPVRAGGTQAWSHHDPGARRPRRRRLRRAALSSRGTGRVVGGRHHLPNHAGTGASDEIRGAVSLPPKRARAPGASRLSLLVPCECERRSRRRARFGATAGRQSRVELRTVRSSKPLCVIGAPRVRSLSVRLQTRKLSVVPMAAAELHAIQLGGPLEISCSSSTSTTAIRSDARVSARPR